MASVREMLEIGSLNNLVTIAKAHQYYMKNYETYFSINHFCDEYIELVKDYEKVGLLRKDSKLLRHMLIEDALLLMDMQKVVEFSSN